MILNIFTWNAFATFLMKMWPLSQDFLYNFSRHFMIYFSELYNTILDSYSNWCVFSYEHFHIHKRISLSSTSIFTQFMNTNNSYSEFISVKCHVPIIPCEIQLRIFDYQIWSSKTLSGVNRYWINAALLEKRMNWKTEQQKCESPS